MLTFAKVCQGFKTKRIAAKTTRLLGKTRVFPLKYSVTYMEYSIGNVVLKGMRWMHAFHANVRIDNSERSAYYRTYKRWNQFYV